MELRQTRVQVLPPTLVTDAGTAWDLAHLEAGFRRQLAHLDSVATHHARRANEAMEGLEAFRRKVVERAIEEKERRGWCSELEEILDDLGLGEFVTREMDVDISFTVTIENCPADGPTQAQVDEAAISFIRHHLGSDHWTIVND